MSQRGGRLSISLRFDYTNCKAIATVDPGNDGTTKEVLLCRLPDDNQGPETCSKMQKVDDGPPEIWIYEFPGSIPGGTYEARATICTETTISTVQETGGGTCGQE